MRELYAELERRHVVRVVVAYIVVGWIFIEVASTILSALGAPDWVVPIVSDDRDNEYFSDGAARPTRYRAAARPR